jgi:two-component system, LytTR family, response regulator
MKRYRTIIIDDEPIALKRLRRLLKEYGDVIDIIDEATNGKLGIEKIETLKPDVVFLDIQMPEMDGFEMLKQLKHLPFVVFTTAYDQYAIKAFETNSIDYLLKPIEKDRIDLTINKLKNITTYINQDELNKFLVLAEQLKPKKEITSIPVKIGDKIILVPLDEIVYMEAKERFVFLHTLDSKEHLIDLPLKTLEEKLPGSFIRVHRSFIINKNQILEIHKYFDGKYVIKMKDRNSTKIISGANFTKTITNIIGF